MESSREELVDSLFRAGIFKLEETRLINGSISPVHIDLRMANGYPKVIRTLAATIFSKICDLKYDLICAVSFTSLPLVVALSIDYQLPMIIKSYDLKNNIDHSRQTVSTFNGPHFPGQKVLVIDDVITLGNSLIETVDQLKSIGLLVDDAIVLVDQVGNDLDYISERSVNLQSIFKLNEIIHHLTAKGLFTRSLSVKENHIATQFSQRSISNIAKPSRVSPVSTISTKSPATEIKSKGFLRFFSKKKSDSSSINHFVRGGIRATAGPRLISEERRKIEVNIPFNKWDNQLLIQWVGTTGLGMYASNFRKWGENAHHLLSLSDNSIEKELGIKKKLHRKKLRLALSAANNDCDPLAKAASQLDYLWIARWLDDIGLPQYKESFLEARIDGSMLHHLTVSDLVQLNVSSKLHFLSLRRGIQVLRQYNFDPSCLKRRAVTDEILNPSSEEIALWTLHRVMEWLRSIDLSEFTSNLRGSGVHGALIVYEPSFDCDLLALLLGIPASRTLLRRHLTTHFQQLIGYELNQTKQEFLRKNPPLLPASKLTINHGKFLLIKRRHKTDVYPADLICPLSDTSPIYSTDGFLENGNQVVDQHNSDSEHTKTDSENESSV
ncbi:liprin-beta-1-like [Brevipalpus obovatus]|uniref:liprin-beta-1-like n=1 Tax=Brevipalpus obovatus TaxID=246614 RepID=UPI003D9F9233